MSKKHKGGPAPAPPNNRPHSGPVDESGVSPIDDANTHPEERFQEQDPKRRMGDFTQTGEHSLQEPGQLNDGDRHSK